MPYTAAQTFEFQLAEQPLKNAIVRFTKITGLDIVADGAVTGKMRARPVSGSMTPDEALTRMLAGTDLQHKFSNSTTVILRPINALDARAQSAPLPEVVVSGQGTIDPKKNIGDPPAPYAGGQVGTGGKLGLLGNRSVMDTPFNQTNYTAKVIQDQQARTIGDVMFNDPSVRTKTPAGNGVDGLYIRGFYYDSGDYSLNGLYGMAPFYSTSTNFIERVEVLKGPSALLGGMPPAGAVGGSVNLVTKTAPNYDITQLTATYASKSTFGTLVDVSRRFGEKKEWGVRFNGGYRNGKTAYDRQTDELGNAVLNLDYRGERVRVSADFGYQAEDLSPPLRFITLNSGPTFPTIAVPPAPSAGTNYMPSWAQWKPKDTFAMVRGEADVTDNVTVYGAYGYHRSTIDYIYTSPRVTNVNGTWTAAPFNGNDTYDNWSGDTGIRASVDTGPVNHLITVNYSSTVREYSAYAKGSSAVTGNLYGESNIPFPASFSLNAQALETMTRQSSVGVADVMSMMNKRLQLFVGARRQTVGVSTTNYLSPLSNNQVENSIWSPAYGVIVKPLENVSVYANYIEGLKAPEAVTNGAFYSNVGAILPAFQTKQKEVGVKVDFGRVTTTLSVFEITNPNPISVPVAGFPLPARQLSGEQRNRGIEFYAFGEVTPSVRVLGGITLIDGKVVNGASSAGTTVLNYDGKVPVGVSNVNVNIGAEWDTPFVRDLTLLGRVVYTGKSYANEANTQELPDWTRVDVGARYIVTSPWNGKPIVLRANIENLFNESYWNSYRTVSNALSLGAPRTYLASATFNF